MLSLSPCLCPYGGVALWAEAWGKPLKCQSNLKPKRVCCIRNRKRNSEREEEVGKERGNPPVPVCVCVCVLKSLHMYLCKYVPNIFRKSKHSLELCVTYNPAVPRFPGPFLFRVKYTFWCCIWQMRRQQRQIPFIQSKFVCLFINCITFIFSFRPQAVGCFNFSELYRKVN